MYLMDSSNAPASSEEHMILSVIPMKLIMNNNGDLITNVINHPIPPRNPLIQSINFLLARIDNSFRPGPIDNNIGIIINGYNEPAQKYKLSLLLIIKSFRK
jgi:hypothetical protein